MINNCDKLEYLNKLPNIQHERQYLSLIAKQIHNRVTMFENSNYLDDIDMETIIESFSDELLEIFAPLIEDYRGANCLHLLKHELAIIYHLQNFLHVFDQEDADVSWIMTCATVKSAVGSVCTGVGYLMSLTITHQTNIHRNHMINPPSTVSHGYNQYLMRKEDYCTSHKNKNTKDYGCASYVNYVATKMRNGNAKLIAHTYIQQFTIVGMQAMSKYLTNNTNKDEIELVAENLTKRQKAWLCYYCKELNKSQSNFCDFCKKGLNPLYFSKQNKRFTVNPNKFGIFKTQPTPNYKNVKFFVALTSKECFRLFKPLFVGCYVVLCFFGIDKISVVLDKTKQVSRI